MKGNIQLADPETQPQSSTGIAELREACITYSSRTGAITSESWQVFDESSDLQCQLDGLMSLLSKQNSLKEPKDIDSVLKKTTEDPTSKVFSDFGTAAAVDSEQFQQIQCYDDEEQKSDSHANLQNTDFATNMPLSTNSSESSNPLSQLMISYRNFSSMFKVIADFQSLQDVCKTVPSKTKFHMLFNIADIGGQPAFLEMLPSLTIGPALYLVFMKLLQGLTTRYPVAFKCKDGRGSKLCKNYTYTSEEVIFTALSSIACFGNLDEDVERYVTKSGDKKQTNSLAFLVGTFRDEIKDKNLLNEINHNLKTTA